MEKLESGQTLAPSGAQGARSATGAALGVASVEVVAKARRRQFSAAYKARILREAEACRATGGIGALLRREGLYSSHLVEWRRLRAQPLRQRRPIPQPVSPGASEREPRYVLGAASMTCTVQ